MVTLETYKELEEQGVFIEYIPEHYNDGSNFNFSIYFRNYKVSTGSYNDGKRGFGNWTTNEESNLLEILDHLNSKKIKFALSNVIEHKGNTNTLLTKFIKSNKYISVVAYLLPT